MSDSGAGGPTRAAPRVGAIALLLGASTLLARVIGYLREVAIANQLGASAATDAFYAAFMLPDILNYLMAGGALTIAFIPLFTRVRSQQGEAAAEELFSTVLGTLGAIVLLAVIGLWWAADALVALQFPNFDVDTRALAVDLTRILLPAQIFFVVGGVLRARLMADNRFAAQALAGLVYGSAMIIGGLVTSTPQGFAWGALAGAFLGHFVLPAADLGRDTALRARIAPLSASFRRYFVLALPLMIGVSLTTVDEWYEKWLGGTLAAATIAYLSFARKLMQAPVTMVGQAIAVAILPALSRLGGEGRNTELNAALGRALAASIGLGALCTAFAFAFAAPIVEAVYQHGAFDAVAAERVSSLLAVLSFGIVAWVLQQVGARAFYAREDMWRPMLLGTGIALASLPLYVLGRDSYAAEGIAAAAVVAMSVNAFATLLWARLRFGGPRLLPLLDALGRAVVVSAVAAVLALGLTPAWSSPWTRLAFAGIVFGSAGVAGMLFVGDEATRATLRALLGRVLRRFRS